METDILFTVTIICTLIGYLGCESDNVAERECDLRFWHADVTMLLMGKEKDLMPRQKSFLAKVDAMMKKVEEGESDPLIPCSTLLTYGAVLVPRHKLSIVVENLEMIAAEKKRLEQEAIERANDMGGVVAFYEDDEDEEAEDDIVESSRKMLNARHSEDDKAYVPFRRQAQAVLEPVIFEIDEEEIPFRDVSDSFEEPVNKANEVNEVSSMNEEESKTMEDLRNEDHETKDQEDTQKEKQEIIKKDEEILKEEDEITKEEEIIEKENEIEDKDELTKGEKMPNEKEEMIKVKKQMSKEEDETIKEGEEIGTNKKDNLVEEEEAAKEQQILKDKEEMIKDEEKTSEEEKNKQNKENITNRSEVIEKESEDEVINHIQKREEHTEGEKYIESSNLKTETIMKKEEKQNELEEKKLVKKDELEIENNQIAEEENEKIAKEEYVVEDNEKEQESVTTEIQKNDDDKEHIMEGKEDTNKYNADDDGFMKQNSGFDEKDKEFSDNDVPSKELTDKLLDDSNELKIKRDEDENEVDTSTKTSDVSDSTDDSNIDSEDNDNEDSEDNDNLDDSDDEDNDNLDDSDDGDDDNLDDSADEDNGNQDDNVDDGSDDDNEVRNYEKDDGCQTMYSSPYRIDLKSLYAKLCQNKIKSKIGSNNMCYRPGFCHYWNVLLCLCDKYSMLSEIANIVSPPPIPIMKADDVLGSDVTDKEQVKSTGLWSFFSSQSEKNDEIDDIIYDEEEIIEENDLQNDLQNDKEEAEDINDNKEKIKLSDEQITQSTKEHNSEKEEDTTEISNTYEEKQKEEANGVELEHETNEIIKTEDDVDNLTEQSDNYKSNVVDVENIEKVSNQEENTFHSNGNVFVENMNTLEKFIEKKETEQSNKIQNLELMIIKLENMILSRSLDKQDEKIESAQLENHILKLEKELVRLNKSHRKLHEQHDILKTNSKKKFSVKELEYIQLISTKHSQNTGLVDSKNQEVIAQQRLKLDTLTQILSNQSEVIHQLTTKSSDLENQNQKLFHIVMNQTVLISQIMTQMQNLHEDHSHTKHIAEGFRTQINSLKNTQDSINRLSDDLGSGARVIQDHNDYPGGKNIKFSSSLLSKFKQILSKEPLGVKLPPPSYRFQCMTNDDTSFCVYHAIVVMNCIPFSTILWVSCIPFKGSHILDVNNSPLLNFLTRSLKAPDAHQGDGRASIGVADHANIIKTSKEKKAAAAEAKAAKDALNRNVLYPVDPDSSRVHDCHDIYKTGQTRSGVYRVYMMGSEDHVNVFCDMGDLGWTVIMRRGDAHEEFYRNFEAYKDGFGGIRKDHYLGNSMLHYMTNQKRYSLRVSLEDWEGNHRTATYQHFWLEGRHAGYKLHVYGYSGDAGDGLSKHSGMKFSTHDVDNDILKTEMGGSCAKRFHGAGWYYKCYSSNLMGKFYKDGKIPKKLYDGIVWKPWLGPNYSMKKVMLAVRPYEIDEH